ncbi:MFS transporter [Leifsonia shinshuensis]|uniref:MFS transporter n=1 Tax=Leifsonia shinshuensis TaxID=150026 RepID=UPI00215633C9|nr:MFS transporter [Leifsonia shinshuensis]
MLNSDTASRPAVRPSPNPSPAGSAPAVRWSRARWLLLFATCIVIALDGLDVSMVGVALPSIGKELGLQPGALQWIVSGYVLGYGSLLLLGGRLADLLGRRTVLLVALSVFTVASLAGGLSMDAGLLIASRFVKGVAAAFTAPAAFSLITTNFEEGPERNKAISIFTTFAASGFSLGLIMSGLMTSLSWRWTFLFSVPLAVLALVLGFLFVPKDARERGAGHDVVGAILLAAGMLLLVYTVVSAPGAGWGSLPTVLGFVVAGVLLAAFVVLELRVRHPLIRFGIFRVASVLRANLTAITLFGSYVSFQFVLTLYLQDVLGWSPLAMALALLPTGLVVVASAPFTDRLIDRFGPTTLIVVGLGSLSAGYLLFLRLGTAPVYWLDVLPPVVLLGVGFGVGFPSIQVQATTGVHDDEQGLAAGLVQTSAQVGGALALAVTTALIAGGPSAGAGSHDPAGLAEQLAHYRPGLYLSAGLALAGLLIAALPRRRRRTAVESAPAEL